MAFNDFIDKYAKLMTQHQIAIKALQEIADSWPVEGIEEQFPGAVRDDALNALKEIAELEE